MSRRLWRAITRGKCAMCGQRGKVIGHHVVTERHVREAGGDPWDLRNRLLLGVWCPCHANHHHAARRIPPTKLPDSSIEFAAELFGRARAYEYFRRYYRGDDPRVAGLIQREEQDAPER